MDDVYGYVGFTVALFSSVVLTRCLQGPAVRIGLVDMPDFRKHHTGQVPLVGGVAMFVAFAAGMLTITVDASQWRVLVAAALLLIVIGVLDDLRELSVRSRIVAQIMAALIACWWGEVVLYDLGDLAGRGAVTLSWLAIPFTVVAIVGVVNAVNMCDGMDGLAGGVTVIALACLAYLTFQAGLIDDFAVISVIVAVIVGFLVWNVQTPWRTRARVFMGDAGSMFLGFVTAWYLIKLSQGEERVLAPVTALWIFAIPLIDTLSLIIRRTLRGRSPIAADRDHLHHLLQSAGLSVRQATSVIWVVAAGLAIVGIVAARYHVSEATMFVSFLGIFFFYNVGVIYAKRSFTNNLHNKKDSVVPIVDNTADRTVDVVPNDVVSLFVWHNRRRQDRRRGNGRRQTDHADEVELAVEEALTSMPAHGKSRSSAADGHRLP